MAKLITFLQIVSKWTNFNPVLANILKTNFEESIIWDLSAYDRERFLKKSQTI